MLFTGWFGRIGVTAIYYALFAYQEHHSLVTFNYVMFSVFISVFVFGGTANLGAIMLHFSFRDIVAKVLEIPIAKNPGDLHHGQL